MDGGAIVAEILRAQGIELLFTLCGGHISPILVGSKARGIRVIDTRHEATAVFAADAVARLTGRPGVAAVTAGPGITNTLTALKNAQMAQSPVILIGGAAPTVLQGRGALQDIDQMALIRSLVKWSRQVRRVRDIAPALESAFDQAQRGVPGPVFLEMPIDILYEELVVRKLYSAERGGKTLAAKAQKVYLDYHVNRLFKGADEVHARSLTPPAPPPPGISLIRQAAQRLSAAARPVILVGSQAVLDAQHIGQLVAAIERIGAPVYLSGMARGLLGRDHPLQLRHKRREALHEADLVLLAGVPADFRLDYGNHIRHGTTLIAANRSGHDLRMNRRPDLGLHGDAALALRGIASALPEGPRWKDWIAQLRVRDDERNAAIARDAAQPADHINPIALCRAIDGTVTSRTILVGDGGDFVATASYIVQPPGPLQWLDPGVFGTLGVGAGFALGAKLVHPEAEVLLLYGDGAAGYSLSEFDTFVRHQVPVIAVVGNDASWSQIAREQVEMLHDDVGTVLAHTDYDRVAAGFGGCGLRLDDPEQIGAVLARARATAQGGQPVLINAILARTDFRKGSISM